MKQKILYILMIITAFPVPSKAINYINETVPTDGKTPFYIYNIVNKKFIRAGAGKSSNEAMGDYSKASLWTYSGQATKVKEYNGNNYIATDVDKTAFTNHSKGQDIYFTLRENAFYQIMYAKQVAIWYCYHITVDGDKLINSYNNNRDKYPDGCKWYVIKQTQFNNYIAYEAYKSLLDKLDESTMYPTAYWDIVQKYSSFSTTLPADWCTKDYSPDLNALIAILKNHQNISEKYTEVKNEINKKKEDSKEWPEGLTVDIDAAMNALNKATTVESIMEAKELTDVKLNRSLPSGFFTATFPFEYNISEIENDKGETAYVAQLALVTYNQKDDYTLFFKKVERGTMTPNQPYVVYLPTGVSYENPSFGNVTVNVTDPGSIAVNNWTMQGNYTPGLSMSGKYGIAEGLFRKGGIDSKINAYTAYFTFLGTQKVRARVAVMDEDGNTTYIGELSDLNGNAAEEVFGIDGMRLPEMRKGINIVRQKDGSVKKIVK